MGRARIAKHREAAREDQDNLCFYCAHPMTDAESGLGSAVTADHLIPQAQGGTSARENIVACCFDCNQKKDCSPAFMPPLSRRKHQRNIRRDETASIRKQASRMAMWRQSMGMAHG